MKTARIHTLLIANLLLGALFAASSIRAQESVVYSEGFENGNGGYVVSGNASWEWGTPSAVGPSSAHSGQKCWGTLLNGSLAGPKEGFLTSPAIAVPALSASQVARVSFYTYVDIPAMQNKGEFLVSRDNLTWQSLVSFYEQSGGGWQRYECDISSYAGGNIYLKYRLYLVAGYPAMPGMYVDDIAITTYTKTGPTKLLTLQASEDLTSSCPWVYTWDGTQFQRDNDIYSVARDVTGKYRDYYLLQQPLTTQDGQYPLQIRETESEESWTDYAGLLAVDHDADTCIAPDNQGNIFAYHPASLVAPVSAQSSAGSNVLSLVNAKDGNGFAAYSQDFVDVDFGAADVSKGAILVLRVKGFMDGTGDPKPFIGPPAVVVQTLGTNGQYQEVGRLLPRFEFSECAFNLAPYLPDSAGKVRVRLSSISHETKYHLIDYVALAAEPEPAKQIQNLALAAASYAGQDITSKLAATDGNSVYLNTGNQFSLTFAGAAQSLAKRDFIFVSEGYYIPHGSTYFIYTWDGSAWTMRDSYGFPTTDYTKTFDLSLFLPDPAGEYKVRIWQNQKESMAAINYVALSEGSTAATLASATYVPTGADISSAIRASDSSRYTFAYAPNRDRWTAYSWTGLDVNHPPTASPATFDGTTITWTYDDADGDDQTMAQVQVWSGPGGSGSCVWSPDALSGTQTSTLYSGSRLVAGQVYYARVKAFDGTSWGAWADAAPFTAASLSSTTTAVSSSANPSAYGDSVTFTATVSGTGGTPSGNITFKEGAATLASVALASGQAAFSTSTLNTGDHTITAQYSGDESFAASSGTASQSVNKAPAGVTLAELSWTYDGTAKSATLSTTPAGLAASVTYEGSSLAPTTAGSYAVSVTITDPNYAGSASGTLVIAKAEAAVSVSGLSQTYDRAAKVPVVSTTPSGLAVSLSYDGSSIAPTSAGSYSVIAAVNDANYAGSTTGTLTIGTVPLLITADSQTRGYGQTNSQFMVQFAGFVTGDSSNNLGGELSFSFQDTNGVSLPAIDTNTAVGSYAILANGLTSSNYALSFVPGTLTITQAVLNVAAVNAARVYGATNPAFTAEFTGLVNGEDTNVLGGELTFSTSADQSSPVGTYTVTAAGLTSSNYAIVFNPGNLDITPASLTVTADSQTKVYGQPNPALTGSHSGEVNGDDLGITFGTLVPVGSPVGSYDIVPAFADLGGKLSNYTIITNRGALTVTSAPLMITADNKSRFYGYPNPPLTVTYNGFVNGDTAGVVTTPPIVTTTAGLSSLVGTNYPISVLGGVVPNYTLSYANGWLAVTKAPLSLLGDNATRSYGAPDPAFTAQVTGVVNGDNITPRFTSTATPTSPPGDYRIYLNVNDPEGKLGQYSVTLKSGTLTITPAALTGQVASQTHGYGQTNEPFSFTYRGFANGEDASVLSATATLSCVDSNGVPVGTNTPAGTYPIQVAAAQTSPNYSIQYEDGTLTVTQAILTVVANDATREYGTPNPAFTASISGFVNGEDTNVLTGTLSVSSLAETNSPVGRYDIVPSGLMATNYWIAFTNGSLTVTPAPLAIAVNNASRTYGAPNPDFSGSITGLRNGDDITATYQTSATLATGAGGYDIEPVLADPGLKLSNYQTTSQKGLLTVTPAPLTGLVRDEQRGYGQTNPVFTVTYSGFMNADGLALLTGPQEFACVDTNGLDVTTNTPVGRYSIMVTNGQSAANYAVSYVPGSLEITQAVLIVAANNDTRVYGTTNPPFTATFTGWVNSEDTNVLGGTLSFTTDAEITSPAGQYAIVPGGLTSSNYGLVFTNGALTIGSAALTATVDNRSRAYGESNPSFTVTYSGFVAGDDASIVSGSPSFSTEATRTSGIGSYDVSASLGTLSASNYAFTFVTGTVTVTQAVLTVTADNLSRSYGQTNPVLGGQLSGVVNNDDITASYQTAATPVSGVGDYDIIPTLNNTDGRLANYAVTITQGTLTITPASLLVAADSASRIYGQANPSLTGTNSGTANGDDLGLRFSTAATPASPSGTYAIEAVFDDPDHKLANYTVTSSAGTLTVAPAALTVTARDQSRRYGYPAPALTLDYTGFVNGDNEGLLTQLPTASTTASPTSWPGSYPITPSGGVSSNYTFGYVPGRLTIGKAPLLVVGDNATRAYGANNPLFTATMTGVMNGDDIQYELTCSATPVTLPGKYDIELWLDDPYDLLGAYDVTLLGGSLAITNAELTGVVQNSSRAYGQDNPAFTVTYTGYANGDSSGILSGTLAYSCNDVQSAAVTRTTPVGSYSVHVTRNQTAPNYTIRYVDGTLEVTQAVLTVTAENATRTYGSANPAFAARYTGFANGETTNALAGALELNTSADEKSSVGSYPITPSGLTSRNYSFQYLNGSLAVTAASLVGAVGDEFRPYGQTNPVFSVSYSGFVNGEDTNLLTRTLGFACVDTNGVNVDTNTVVGSYAVRVIEPQTASNYAIQYTDGSLTITQAVLTVAAKDVSRLYGDTNPVFEVTFTGFANGEDTNVVQGAPELSASATTDSPVGTYAIEVRPGTLVATNYSFSLSNGVLTVGQALITVTADSQSRTYGDTNPVLTVKYSGFVGSDTATVLSGTPEVSTSADANSPVGEYVLAVAQRTLSTSNYAFAFTPGTLTVTPAPLVVSAQDQSRLYGDPNPELSGTINGLQNGDAITAAYNTTADSGSGVGTYPIAVTLSDPEGKLGNYSVTTNQGSLSINPAPLTVTAADQLRPYGALNPSFTAAFNGLRNNDTITAACVTSAGPASPAGSYPIDVNLSDPDGKLGNYAVTINRGTLTVTAALVLTAQPGFYVVANDPALVDTNALVLDGGSLDFANGLLSVAIVTNGSVQDALAVPAQGGGAGRIGLQGNTVTFGDAALATASGGDGTNKLAFALSTNITSAQLTALLRQVTFATTDTNTALRVIEVALTYSNITIRAQRSLNLNRPPTAVDDDVWTAEGLTVEIPYALVLANNADADGDPISITACSLVSAYGGRVSADGTNFTYRPSAEATTEDVFAYLITDGRGGESVGVVTVHLVPWERLQVDISDCGNTGVRLRMGVNPGATYEVQATADLVNWTTIRTVTATSTGVIDALDSDARNYPQRFYRAIPK
jgi:hypothetical protein